MGRGRSGGTLDQSYIFFLYAHTYIVNHVSLYADSDIVVTCLFAVRDSVVNSLYFVYVISAEANKYGTGNKSLTTNLSHLSHS